MGKRPLPVYALILLALGLILTVGSVGTAASVTILPGTTTTPAENYFPLTLGNQWHFRVQVAGQTLWMTYIATDKAFIDGVATVTFETRVNDLPQTRENYQITGDGVFTVLRQMQLYSFKFNPKQILLKYPVVSGDAWEQIGSFGDASKNATFQYQQKCRYVGFEDVQVPAGNFRAIKLALDLVASDGSHIQGFRYFSQDVGLIKEDLTMTVNQQRVALLSELDSYQLAK